MNFTRTLIFTVVMLALAAALAATAYPADIVWVVAGDADGNQTTFAAKPAKPGDKPLPAGLKSATSTAVDAATDTITAKAGDKVLDLLTRANGKTLLLPTGSVWGEKFAVDGGKGRGPRRIGVAGTGSAPVVRVRGTTLDVRNVDGLLIEGIAFDGVNHSDTAVVVYNKANNVSLHGVAVSNGRFGLTVQSCTNFTLSGSKVCDNYNPLAKSVSDVAYASGLYADSVDGVVITDNFADGNGRALDGSASPTLGDHNFYIKPSCTGYVFLRNIVARSGSHGLQARCGGIVEDNLFLDCPIAMSFGLVNGQGPVKAGGVTGSIARNAFCGAPNLGPLVRGYAIEISNTLNVEVRENVFDGAGAQHAIKLDQSQLNADYKGPAPIGVEAATFSGNVYRWSGGAVGVYGGLSKDGKGSKRLGPNIVLPPNVVLPVVDWREVLGADFLAKARTGPIDAPAALAKLREATK